MTSKVRTRFAPWPLARILWGVVALGGLTLVLGLALEPKRTWANLLLANSYVLGLGLGGLLFVAIGHVTKAGWSTSFRRVPEAMSATLPTGAALMALFAIGAGVGKFYPWQQAGAHLTGEKALWLTYPFFLGRTMAYLAIWVGFAWMINRVSRRQDEDRQLAHTHRSVTLSAVFLLLFGLTVWLSSLDWIMTLEYHWYSTMFGVYNFAGIFVSALAAITLIVIVMRRRGEFAGKVTNEHLHGLGKLIFAFSTFWMYIWYSQYMLIWYAHTAEEVGYYSLRLNAQWGTLTVISLLLNWVIPFFTLMPRSAKRSESVLIKVCVILLIGRWFDLFIMIQPPIMGENPGFGPWEIFPFLGIVAAFVLVFMRAFRSGNAVPIGDPTLEESVHHHQ